jgi:hypothetical protein
MDFSQQIPDFKGKGVGWKSGNHLNFLFQEKW